MSILKALAVSIKPILTFSIKVEVDSEAGTGSVTDLGAGSPPNLVGYRPSPEAILKMKVRFGLQIRHDHKETFACIFVCLELIVYGVHASSTA